MVDLGSAGDRQDHPGVHPGVHPGEPSGERGRPLLGNGGRSRLARVRCPRGYCPGPLGAERLACRTPGTAVYPRCGSLPPAACARPSQTCGPSQQTPAFGGRARERKSSAWSLSTSRADTSPNPISSTRRWRQRLARRISRSALAVSEPEASPCNRKTRGRENAHLHTRHLPHSKKSR